MPQISLQPSSADFELLVDYDYQPYEPPERGPEAAYPGCPESVTIECITLNGMNITALVSEATFEELEDKILEALNDERLEAQCASYDLAKLWQEDPF